MVFITHSIKSAAGKNEDFDFNVMKNMGKVQKEREHFYPDPGVAALVL